MAIAFTYNPAELMLSSIVVISHAHLSEVDCNSCSCHLLFVGHMISYLTMLLTVKASTNTLALWPLYTSRVKMGVL